MLFILGLTVVNVNGVELKESTRLSLLVALQSGFLLLNSMVRPHRFSTIYYLEMGSVGLNCAATYLLLLTTFGNGSAIVAHGIGINAAAWIVLTLLSLYGLVLLRYAAISLWRRHQETIQKIGTVVVRLLAFGG